MWLALATCLALLATVILFFRRTSQSLETEALRRLVAEKWRYCEMKDLVRRSRVALPAMFVDLDVFDGNVRRIVDIAASAGKSLRIATKSIRCPDLIRRITELSGGTVSSYMCYSIHEAALLSEQGLDDFYIPYPTMQHSDIAAALSLVEKGRKVALTVDSVAHVQRMDHLCEDILKSETKQEGKEAPEASNLRVAVDLDLSYKMFWGLLHLGAHRSKVRSVEQFAGVAKAIRESRHLLLAGAMGYEAHVAGLPDNNPHSPFLNPLIRYMKKFFYGRTVDLRAQVADYCRREGIELEFFNGGGTGNIRDVSRDPAVTEVTAGSAFLQANLFDYYLSNECLPAFAFALQATRINPDYICCQSGGFVASGSCSPDKFPVPFANPYILSQYPDEGVGEVQTPLRIRNLKEDVVGAISLGDPVFLRPAKSGEIAEHFDEYLLKRGYEIVAKAKTYHGLQHTFY